MASINFISKGQDALNLYKYSQELKGDSAQFLCRTEVRKSILKAWPELDGENKEDRPEEVEFTEEQKQNLRLKRLNEDTRQFVISASQQTALAEGFLKFCMGSDEKDFDKMIILHLAKLCKCRYKFLEPRLSKVEIREFAESDEEIELDS